MEKTDYIIVGSGIAGITLAHQLKQAGYKIKIISEPSLSKSSRVAAGIFNPVVFFRITKSYLADLALPFAIDYYTQIESLLSINILQKKSIAKFFGAPDEPILWMKRMEEGVGSYLGEINTQYTNATDLNAKHGLGMVHKAGALDCGQYMDASLQYFGSDFIREKINYSKISFVPEGVIYNDIQATKMIFCEGHFISENPFFNYIQLKPVKGEVLTIEFEQDFPEGSENFLLNKKCYLLPLGQHKYRVGATYNWKDLNEEVSEAGLAELTAHIQEITPIPFKVLVHNAGVRPASIDRRPIIGTHPEHEQLAVFNGLGAKGVMLAPYFAKELVLHLTQKKVPHKEYGAARFNR